MEDLDRRIRTAVYERFVATARPPSVGDLAGSLIAGGDEIIGGLHRLEAAHALALAPGSDNVWMAHPFSAVPTEFRVESATGRYWANCAWDALGIAAVLRSDTTCVARCPESGEPIDLGIRGGAAASGGSVVQFVVPARRFWDNVGYT